jgi:hypothetical protein
MVPFCRWAAVFRREGHALSPIATMTNWHSYCLPGGVVCERGSAKDHTPVDPPYRWVEMRLPSSETGLLSGLVIFALPCCRSRSAHGRCTGAASSRPGKGRNRSEKSSGIWELKRGGKQGNISVGWEADGVRQRPFIKGSCFLRSGVAPASASVRTTGAAGFRLV